MADYDVVVIGAGCGGLSAGALLAKQGRKVLVLEQSDLVGGCCSTFEKDGYHFDVGASILEVIAPIERAFAKLDTTFQAEVNLIPCDPILSCLYPDGSRLTYPQDLGATAALLEKLSPGEAQNWQRYAAYFSELTEVVLDTLFGEPANGLLDMARMVRKNPRLLKFLPTFATSYQDMIQRYFHDSRILQSMAYQSLYIGLPPELVPGTFALLPFTEHLGVYYPRGGMIQIPLAFQRCGERFGLEVRLNTQVGQVMVRGGQVAGVVLTDGTEITCDVIVSDINAKTLYLQLIGEAHLPWLTRVGIQSYEYSTSVPMIYLGVDSPPPLDAHHSLIAISMEGVNDYWWNNARRGQLRDKPFGLICWPTRTDLSLAPEGQHVLNLIPDGFYRLGGTDWDAEKPRYVERVINFLSASAVPGLAEHVKVVECATPLDFERRLLLPEGAIYALQEDAAAQAMFRPSSKSKSIRGLYLAGASTHPGGGVPATIASGAIAARLIERYEQ